MRSGRVPAASSGKVSLRPPIAVRKTCPSATASIDDDAYGRSFTWCAMLDAPELRKRVERTSAIGSTSSSSATVHRSSVASG